MKESFNDSSVENNHKLVFHENSSSVMNWSKTISNFNMPNSDYFTTLKVNKLPIISNVTNNGMFGERIIEHQNHSPSRHIILTGCSFVYGINLKNEETLGANLEKMMPKYRTVNFGIPAGSIANAHKMFKENVDLSKLSLPQNGFFIFSMYIFQLARVLDTPSWAALNLEATPHYELERNQIKYLGNFHNALLHIIRKFIGESKLLMSLRSLITVASDLTKSELGYGAKLSAALMEEVKNKYLSEFPQGNFVVVLHLGEYPEWANRVAHELKQRSIKYVFADIDKINKNNTVLFIPQDGHPKKIYNELFARFIQNEIVNKKTQ
jgi:hypothetical protein